MAPNLFFCKTNVFTVQNRPGNGLFQLTWMEARRSYTLLLSLISNSCVPQWKYDSGWFAFQQIVVYICAILPCNNFVNCQNIQFLLPLDIDILGLDIFPQVSHLKREVLTINKFGGVSFNRWKEIADRSPCLPRSQGLLVNECMYWCTYSLSRPRTNPILSFDFESEKFLVISPLSPFEDYVGLSLMDLKGMFCLPDVGRLLKSSILDVWILEDKISCSWVKEYSIRLIDFGYNNITSDCKTCNEEILFRHLDKVVFYDLKKKSFREVEALSPLYNRYGIYSKSLFSLGTI